MRYHGIPYKIATGYKKIDEKDVKDLKYKYEKFGYIWILKLKWMEQLNKFHDIF